jgi:hypothetical protein
MAGQPKSRGKVGQAPQKASKPPNPLDAVDWDALVSEGLKDSPLEDVGVGGVPGVRGRTSPPTKLTPGYSGYDIPDPADIAAKDFEPIPDYYKNLAAWIEYKLGERIWTKQIAISNSLQSHRYTAVQSCHGAGKSYIASRAIANWIDAHPPGDAFVVTTAPTAAQVSAILWREVQKAHKKGELAGNIITAGYPQWKLDGELVGYGRKPADYADSAFQGIHAPFILIVIDEASGVDVKLFNAVDALATNKNARVLVIGNPDDPTSHFARVCKPGSGWNVIRIDGLRSPNMSAANVRMLIEQKECLQCELTGRSTSLLEDLLSEEEIPYSEEPVSERVADSLISPLWVEERLHRWVGAPSEGNSIAKLASQSSLFTAKVRGLFPDSNTDGVIPLGWIEAAIVRWNNWNDAGRPQTGDPRRVVGADIARFGEDSTSLAIRRGWAVESIRKFHYSDTMETTGHIVALLTNPADIAVVDVIGVGAGVVDRMRELQVPNLAFNASASAKSATGVPVKDRSGEWKFKNLRAAAWWNLRELLDPATGSEIMLPDDELLRADLVAPRVAYESGGVIKIESKDDIRKRLGRSTDSGDSVVQAYWTDSESSEFYTETGRAVPWWETSDSPDDREALRWVPADAVENWLNDKENQLREDDLYGGFGSSASRGF